MSQMKPDQIMPGAPGQVLATVAGKAAWAVPSPAGALPVGSVLAWTTLQQGLDEAT